MTAAVVLFLIAITLATWSLVASHTSGRRADLERHGGRDSIYEAVCFDHEHDPLEGKS